MMSNRMRAALAILAGCCIAAFSLLLLFNDAVRGVVLDPMIEGINAARYMLGYVPQDLQWIFTLLLASVLTVIYFACRIPKRARPTRAPRSLRFPSQGPAMRLAHIVEKSSRNKFSREQVILELRDLAARSLAYRQGISVDEARESLDTTRWTDDSSVSDFLSLDKHRAGEQKHRGFQDQVDHALAHIERTYQEV